MSARTFFFLTGFFMWLAATIVIRLWGHHIWQPDPGMPLLAAFAVVLVFIPFLCYWLYRLKKVTGTERVIAAMLLALPGMVMDAGVMLFFTTAFPNLSPLSAPSFGGWLLYCYALTLLTGILPRSRS